MIVRIHDDYTVTVVKGIHPSQEEEFLRMNPKGYKRVDSLPESRFGKYKYDPKTDSIVVDEEAEIEIYKQHLIDRANELVKDYILEHYPLEKQNADDQQKEYYGTAILMIRASDSSSTPITLDHIYLEIGHRVNEIFDGKSLEEVVSAYPENEQYYWEQLIKAGLRKAWVIKCVYVFNDYKRKVLNVNSLEELEELDVQMLDFPPFPL